MQNRSNDASIREETSSQASDSAPVPGGPAPQLIVEHDVDGYFEVQVRRVLASLATSPYRVVRIRALPFLPDAVQYQATGAEIRLLFYAALRRGFGSIDWAIVGDLLSGSFPGKDC